MDSKNFELGLEVARLKGTVKALWFGLFAGYVLTAVALSVALLK